MYLFMFGSYILLLYLFFMYKGHLNAFRVLSSSIQMIKKEKEKEKFFFLFFFFFFALMFLRDIVVGASINFYIERSKRYSLTFSTSVLKVYICVHTLLLSFQIGYYQFALWLKTAACVSFSFFILSLFLSLSSLFQFYFSFQL